MDICKFTQLCALSELAPVLTPLVERCSFILPNTASTASASLSNRKESWRQSAKSKTQLKDSKQKMFCFPAWTEKVTLATLAMFNPSDDRSCFQIDLLQMQEGLIQPTCGCLSSNFVRPECQNIVSGPVLWHTIPLGVGKKSPHFICHTAKHL